MRIITGTLRGRTIQTVPGTTTRPTSDKIKEAIFHVIGPYFDGGTSLDLYAGSGSLGIEAISRGMDRAVFIDRANEAIKTIRKNIKQLEIEESAEIYRNSALRALEILARKLDVFDLIFIDPPYDSKEYTAVLQKIKELDLARNRGIIYVEHHPNKELTYDESFYELYFHREYSKEIAV